MSQHDRMTLDTYRSESDRGALAMGDVEAGLTIRRLAREHKLRPDTEVVETLDDPMLRIRYCARRGVSTDDFAELLSERVTVGRPTHDRVLELIGWACSGRRPTRLEEKKTVLAKAETRDLAATECAAADAALTAWQERVRRGSKLIPWVCQCAGVTVQVSYKARFNATCNTCGERYEPKYRPPSIDLGTVLAASEPAPF